MSKAARSNRPLCPSKFKVGERVTENMKSITYVSPFADKKIKDTVAKYYVQLV